MCRVRRTQYPKNRKELGRRLVPHPVALRTFILFPFFLSVCLLFSCTDEPQREENDLTPTEDVDALADLGEVGADTGSPDGAADGEIVENNGCGGTSPLSYDEVLAEPGGECGPCGGGVLACLDQETLTCIAPMEPNECGGCEVLPGMSADACGSCGDGTFSCGPDGELVCSDESEENGCGGCDELAAPVGLACTPDGGSIPSGVWVCQSLDVVHCAGPGENACGGAVTIETPPGSPCGICGLGVTVCDGPTAVQCEDEHAGLNTCGGCGPLPAEPETPCGVCDGSWTCDDDGYLTCLDPDRNACGGCEDLGENLPGDSCGDGLRWACDGFGAVTCIEETHSACGGNGELDLLPGEVCGACDDGFAVCVTDESTACAGAMPTNACGGCGALQGVPDEPCGVGYEWQCSEGTLACVRAAPANLCGGTESLPYEPGGLCGNCNTGVWLCVGSEGVFCFGELADVFCDDEVTTDEVTAISAGEATLNGSILTLPEDVTGHGFCWSETGTPSLDDDGAGSDCVDLGEPSTPGRFDHTVATLSPGRVYTVRAFVDTTAGVLYGAPRDFETLRPVPTGLVATLGDFTDRVVVFWNPVVGATGYEVWRDGFLIAEIAADAPRTHHDEGADAAPTVSEPRSVVATLGTRTGDVEVTWLPPAPTTGTVHRYSVRATFPAGPGDPTEEVEGFRGAHPVLSYDIRVGPATWVSLGMSLSFIDSTAPPGAIEAAVAVASDGESASHVSLSLEDVSTTTGDTVSYAIRAVTGLGAGPASDFVSGFRGIGDLTYQWERSAGDNVAVFSDLAGATSATYVDLDAPANGEGRYYRCRLSAIGAQTYTTGGDRGSRQSDRPMLTTGEATEIGAVEATLHGEITALGTPAATIHGFCWSTAPTPELDGPDDACSDLGEPSAIGEFDLQINALESGTTYHGRAFARNQAGIAYGDNVSFLTAPAPPGDVSAGDGTSSDHVRVTWTAVTGADSYRVYRNGTELGATNDTFFEDATAAPGGAPILDSLTVSASNGDHTDRIAVTWTTATVTAGDTYSYTVRAINANGDSDLSGADDGFRAGPPVDGYRLRVGGGGWTEMGLLTAYDDGDAPAGTIDPGTANASNGSSEAGVVLTLVGAGSSPGALVSYEVTVYNDEDEVGPVSDTGYRGVDALTYQWQRSVGDTDAEYADLTGATSATHDDLEAPVDGSGHYYRCVVSGVGADPATSGADRGFRSAVPEVTTEAVTGIQQEQAEAAGVIVTLGGPPASDHGFCWSEQEAPALTGGGGSSCVHLAAPAATGRFVSDITSLQPGTLYYVRAFAIYDAGTVYGDQESFWTLPAAPTGLLASDGDSSDGVIVTWNPSDGATYYILYRDGVQVSDDFTSGDTDTGAGGEPPDATGLAVEATNGTVADSVLVTWSEPSVSSGPDHVYTVAAGNPSGVSGPSGSDIGFRLAQPITGFDIEIGGRWTDAESMDSYQDYGAPAGSVFAGSVSATKGTSSEFVALTLPEAGSIDGVTVSYRVRARNLSGVGASSPLVTGYRGVGALTYRWQRSAGSGNSDFDYIPGATADSVQDTGAPASGLPRYYRCRVGAEGIASAFSSSDYGYRLPGLTGVWTGTVTDISTSGASFNGEISTLGNSPPTAHGFCWGTAINPTYDAEGVVCIDLDGRETTGTFTASTDGLSPETTYHVRAFAENVMGYAYGGDVSFVTDSEP